ncbi:hypothetical protein [Bacillus gobiensis]
MNGLSGLLVYFTVLIILLLIFLFPVKSIFLKLTNFLGKIVALKILQAKISKNKSKTVLKLTDVAFLIIIFSCIVFFITFIFQGEKNYFMLAMIIYTFLLILWSEIFQEIKKELDPNYKPWLVEQITRINRILNIKKDTYFMSRLLILINSFPTFTAIYAAVFVVLTGFVSFNIPINVQYVLLITIPLCFNGFIYWPPLSFKVQSVRRSFVYFLIIAITFWIYLKEYKGLATNQNLNDHTQFLILFFIGIFIAVDRFLKSIADDIKDYMKENE